MNRRWQKEGAGRYSSLQSIGSFANQLPKLHVNLGIADLADVYSTYSHLHSKGRNPRALANQEQGFYYFIADVPQAASARVLPQSIPHGEPSSMAPNMGAAAHSQQEHAAMQQDNPAASSAAHTTQQSAQPCGQQQQQLQADHQHQPQPSLQPSLQQQPYRHVEPVVPVSSKCTILTMELLSKLFYVHVPGAQQYQGSGACRDGDAAVDGSTGPQAPVKHMLLAIADDDGSVSLTRLFSYMQAPLEGPEALAELLQDAADEDSD